MSRSPVGSRFLFFIRISQNQVFHVSSVSVYQVLKLLFKNGANINALDNEGSTPLMTMLERNVDVKGRRIKALKYLLEKWPDVNTFALDRGNVLNVRNDEDCQKIIIEHLAKMEMLNLPIHSSLLNTISENNKLNNHFTKCKEELFIANSTKIHHNYSITFFKLLIVEEKLLIIYGRNQCLTESFKKIDTEKMFPIYGPSMRKKLEKGIKRLCLHNRAEEFLKKLFPNNSNPSHLILRNITSYLEKEDLRNLCELNTELREQALFPKPISL